MLLLHIDTSSQSPLLQGSSNADLQKEAQEILSVLTSLMQCLDGSSVVSHPGDDHAASPLYRLHFREVRILLLMILVRSGFVLAYFSFLAGTEAYSRWGQVRLVERQP